MSNTSGRARLRIITVRHATPKAPARAADATAAFELRDQGSIGPEGELVLPKLFRRCGDSLRTRAG